MAQTVILRGDVQRAFAKKLIDKAPANAVVRVKEAKRSDAQNDKMWAMLADVSRSKPEGRQWADETWKCAFMHALGHQVKFAEGLDGSGPFPLGFRSSRLTVRQMADLITYMQEYGDRHGVRWSDEWAEQQRDAA
ncbi:recombination protein NinB [Kaistia terrae]|uniref:Recombination protein NinB n=1 Tax=Kaistia terrae TaxID=537017 RepID=A0ABW0Q3N6_9HYPH|nr:recombination protein NinB [Kaistia terrae]MCX5581465.1 recombination protein NinB [Kaistia terrae]